MARLDEMKRRLDSAPEALDRARAQQAASEAAERSASERLNAATGERNAAEKRCEGARLDPVIPPDQDEAVIAADERGRAAHALQVQLEQVLADNDLDQQARDAIDEAHARVATSTRRFGREPTDGSVQAENAILTRFGFDSYLEYSIAISTGTLRMHAERTLERLRGDIEQAHRALVEARRRAVARVEAKERELAELEDAVTACVEAERAAVHDVEVAVAERTEADRDVEERHAEHTALITEHETAEAESKTKAAALAEANDEVDRLASAVFAPREIEAHLDALRTLVDRAAQPFSTLVLLDEKPEAESSAQVDDRRSARTIALLEAISVEPLGVRFAFVTDDPEVITWARALDRRAGWLVELEDPKPTRARWWRTLSRG